MTIKSLSVQNFRSFQKKAFEFSPFTTFVLGANATGKTTILESISLLSTAKGFRTGSDTEMITLDKEVGRASGIIESATELVEKERESEEKSLEIVLTRGLVMGVKTPLKKYMVNGIPRRSFDFAGTLLSVLFSPSDLELVTDSPSIRRRFLDHVLIQADREYRRNLSSYERGVRQRNKVLEAIRDEGADPKQLVFWDQLIIKAGGYITEKRREFVEFVNKFKIPASKSRSDLNYSLIYDVSLISPERLFQYKNAETASATTLVGPHRDDVIFNIFKTSPVNLKSYGSRGEQRLGVLWAKLAEISYLEKCRGERPILLLDDIFSELDEEHQDLVFEITKNQQTIIAILDPAWAKEADEVIEL